jgi:4-hydroxybenzoate polyprenyltransferase
MGWQTQLLFSIPTDPSLLGFFFSGTLCSYNFHWYLSLPDSEKKSPKSSFTGRNRLLHLILACLGLAVSVYFSIVLWDKILFILSTAVFTFLYSAPKIPLKAFAFLKRIAIGKTIFLSAAWTHVTAVLPFLVEEKPVDAYAVLYFINRFFFIYSICILFDYRDRTEDRKQNIRSLITYLDEKGINRLYWFSLGIFYLTLAAFYPVFSLTEMLFLLLPALPLTLWYRYFKQNTSDYNYYFILDGLMILSAPLLVFAKFAR